MIEEDFPIKQRVMLLYVIIEQKTKDVFELTYKFFVNLRYYRLWKRFIRNVNHVAGTVQSPITIKMVNDQQDSVRTYDTTAAIGYNQRKQWLDQLSKRDQELSAIREEYNSKNSN